jgi:hypothetical protein
MDRELFIVVGSTVLLTLVIVGGSLVGRILWDKNIKCPKFGEATELESKYVLFGGGCFVKTEKGQWVKDENYWNSPIDK